MDEMPFMAFSVNKPSLPILYTTRKKLKSVVSNSKLPERNMSNSKLPEWDSGTRVYQALFSEKQRS